MYPKALFNYMEPSVNATVDDLAKWTEQVKEPRWRARAARAGLLGQQAAAGAAAGIAREATP